MVGINLAKCMGQELRQSDIKFPVIRVTVLNPTTIIKMSYS